MPGVTGAWTEPTGIDLHRVFLDAFQRIVSPDLYSLNRNLMTLTLHSNPPTIVYLISRSVNDASRQVGRGLNLGWVIHDEAAKKFNRRVFDDILNCVRLPDAPYHFVDTLSTPQMNDYYTYVHSDKAAMQIHFTSYDNPYISHSVIGSMESNLSGTYAAQEIYGEWVAQSGRVWAEFSDTDWPHGNMVDQYHNPQLPYIIACDLGVHSAWLILQHHPQTDGWVIIGEYTPDAEGAATTIQRINAEYGHPLKVIAGQDLYTRGIADGQTAHFYFVQAWGYVPMVTPDKFLAAKDIQHNRLCYAICDSRQQRRLFVSRRMKSHDPDSHRGVLDMMRRDTWDESPKSGEYLPKDGHLEHMRDALLYLAVCTWPPILQKGYR
jgi:hypothetical protein